MIIKELLERESKNFDDYEVYKWTNKNKTIHTDYVKLVDDFSMETEVDYWEIMNEEEYGNTILANSCEYADFEMWYDDKEAKVLIIVVEE